MNSALKNPVEDIEENFILRSCYTLPVPCLEYFRTALSISSGSTPGNVLIELFIIFNWVSITNFYFSSSVLLLVPVSVSVSEPVPFSSSFTSFFFSVSSRITKVPFYGWPIMVIFLVNIIGY